MTKVQINKKVATEDAPSLAVALENKLLISATPVEGKIVNYAGVKWVEVDKKRFTVPIRREEESVLKEKYPHGIPLCGDPNEKTVKRKEEFYFLPPETAQEIWNNEPLPFFH